MPAYYHCSVDVIGRAKGRSAVACAAYRSGSQLNDERYGTIHDYRPRKGILQTGIIAPENSPAWVTDRERLWNGVELRERRKDAQLAREFILGLPAQLSPEEQKASLEQFIRQEITPHGLVADYAIHAPNREGDQRNHHAHVMVTMRPVSENGFEANKERAHNSPEQLVKWREAWADIQNQAFERNGVTGEDGRTLRVDHRSYEKQGLDIEPTVHLGVHATAMERRGKKTELGDMNRDIQSSNDNRRVLRRQSKGMLAGDARERLEARLKDIQEMQREASNERDDFGL